MRNVSSGVLFRYLHLLLYTLVDLVVHPRIKNTKLLGFLTVNRRCQRKNAGTHPTRGAQAHLKWGRLFFSNPQVHHYPWSAPLTVPNHRIFTFLKRQTFQATKRCLAAPLKQAIDRLGTKTQQARWQRAALDVSPAHLWGHGYAVTEHQLWTRYRHATGQLCWKAICRI